MLDDVVIISARAGDLVVIPPDYGHISINPSPETTLVMANIVSTAFQSEYGEYEKYHGAAYYVMGSGKIQKNSSYASVPPVRYIGATCASGIHHLCKGPLYDLIGNESALSFLNEPEKFLTVFSVLLKD
jgi:glucose-6-phosphate isomerase